MVARFHRSFSLPGSPRHKTRPAAAAPEKSYHVRSISLPCRSHPLLSRLDDDIRSLASWISTRPESSSWICDGLSRLDLLHASLGDLLALPQTQETLRRRRSDHILEDFLRFADAHGSFRSEALALGEHLSEAQLALRRRDAAGLSIALRSVKHTEKQIVKIASLLREVSKSTRFADGGSTEEAELMATIRGVVNVTVSASAAVFLEVAAVSAATSAAVAAGKGTWSPLRRSAAAAAKSMKEEEWRKEAMERLEVEGEWIGAVESGSERLFRCLINTRVSLLNIFTP